MVRQGRTPSGEPMMAFVARIVLRREAAEAFDLPEPLQGGNTPQLDGPFDIAWSFGCYLLPLATNTSLGQIVNARTLENQISRLLSSEHREVRRVGQRYCRFGGVGHEELFAGDAHALAAIAGVDLLRPRLKHRRVSVKPLTLHTRLGDLLRIANLLDDDRLRHGWIVSGIQEDDKIAARTRLGTRGDSTVLVRAGDHGESPAPREVPRRRRERRLPPSTAPRAILRGRSPSMRKEATYPTARTSPC